MEIVKRDLASVKVQESKASKAKARMVYPFRDSEGTSPKDYLLVYDSNYYETGLAWILEALERTSTKRIEWNETIIEQGLWKYYESNQIAKEDGTKRVDLPLWISASAIVSACVHKRDFGNALYGVAWALFHANESQAQKLLACFESCAPKPKAQANLIKGSVK